MDLSEVDSSTSCDADKKQKQFMCPFEDCKESFAKHSKVLHHVRKHTGERPYVCDEKDCTKAYTNSSHLRRHKAMLHTKKEKVICTHPGCKLEFYNSSNMKRHVARVHAEIRKYPFMCDKCNEGFPKKRLLQKHSFVHTGVKGFECEVCNLRFAVSTDLNRHKRTHTTYTCECGEQYERWTALLKHKRETHKPDTTCSECGKKFADINILRQHKKKIHVSPEDVTMFQCPRDGCMNNYMYKKNLREHIKYFHDKKPKKKIPCPIEDCGAFLSRMQCLKKHLELHKTGVVKKVNRKTRWDAGIPRKSTASELSGLPLTHDQNQILLNDEGINTELLMEMNGESAEEHITVTPDIQPDFEFHNEEMDDIHNEEMDDIRNEEMDDSESDSVPNEESEVPEISGDLDSMSDDDDKADLEAEKSDSEREIQVSQNRAESKDEEVVSERTQVLNSDPLECQKDNTRVLISKDVSVVDYEREIEVLQKEGVSDQNKCINSDASVKFESEENNTRISSGNDVSDSEEDVREDLEAEDVDSEREIEGVFDQNKICNSDTSVKSKFEKNNTRISSGSDVSDSEEDVREDLEAEEFDSEREIEVLQREGVSNKIFISDAAVKSESEEDSTGISCSTDVSDVEGCNSERDQLNHAVENEEVGDESRDEQLCDKVLQYQVSEPVNSQVIVIEYDTGMDLNPDNFVKT